MAEIQVNTPDREGCGSPCFFFCAIFPRDKWHGKEATIMFEIGKLPSLDLGYQGENKVRTIDIDMTAWLEEYPGSKVALMVKRPDEDVYYPAGKM